MKKSLKILSVFLAVLTFFGILSAATPVFAANVNEYIADKEYTEKLLTEVVENDTEEKSPIVKEVVEKRDEYQKVYLREDGTYTSVISKTPVHYKKDGEWVDIVNNLKTDGDVITNTAGSFNVEFPKEISEDNEIKIENGKETITFSIVETEKSNGKVKNNKKQKQDKNKVSDEEIFNNDISRTVSEIEYEDVLENTNLEYVVTPTGVKENIIVENKESLKKSYSFNITKGNLKAELDKENNLYFKNSKGEIVFTIPAPVMTDSNGTISYDIDVKVKNLKEKTITLTYTPDKKWLNDKNRTYPVAIDPVIILDSDKEFVIEDTIVGYDTTDPETATQNGIDTFLAILLNNGTIRSDLLVKFNSNLVNTYKQPNIVVTDVNYLVNGGVINGNILVKPISGSWDASTITGEDVFVDEEETPTITYDDEVIDYYTGRPVDAGDGDVLYFNITNLFNEWLNGTHSNDGFALMLDNENAQALFSVSGYYTYKGNPKYYYSYCTVDYIESSGNNSNYEYLNQDVGRAGTFNVNTFTRALSGYREDLSLPGNRMPVSVGFNYNSALVNYLKWYTNFASALDEEQYSFYSPYGESWSPNYLKMLFLSFDENEVYYFTDTGSMAVFTPKEETVTETNENGGETISTKLVFEENSNSKTGYELSLINQDSDPSFDNMVITTPIGEREYFDENGFIIKITEEEPNSTGIYDEINIVYEEDYTSVEADLALPKIDFITDGIGRTFDFIYTSDKLTSIICKNGSATIKSGSTNIDCKTTYTYSGNNLVAVNYPTENSTLDKMEITYTYDSSGKLTKAKNIDNYNISYTYDSAKKITHITEKANTVTGNEIILSEIGNRQTKIVDKFLGTEIQQFGKDGKLTYTFDDKGNFSKSENSQNADENVSVYSGWDIVPTNLLKNGSFETLSNSKPSYWTNAFGVYNSLITEEVPEPTTTDYACKVTGTTKQTQTVATSGAKVYTFSFYAKEINNDDTTATTNTGFSFEIEATYPEGTTTAKKTQSLWISPTDDFEQYTVTVIAPSNISSVTVGIGGAETVGEFLVDNAQLEKGYGTANYNYIQNGSFNYGLNYWSGGKYEKYSNIDNATLKSSLNPIVSTNINNNITTALKLDAGLPVFNVLSEDEAYLGDVYSSAIQTVEINGKKDDIYSLGGWFKGEFTTGLLNENLKTYFETDGTPLSSRIAQIKASYSYKDSNNQLVTEDFAVDFSSNVDGWQYAKDSFALKADVETIKITVIAKNIPVTTYFANISLSKDEDSVLIDDSETTCTCGCEACNYGENCPCTGATNNECQCPECLRKETSTKDNFGNILSSKTTSGLKYIETFSTYTSDGNQLYSTTDENGNTTVYDIDILSGILESISSPVGTGSDTTTTSYTYDAKGNVKTVSTTTGTSLRTLNYAYNKDKLVGIVTPNDEYEIEYDDWGQVRCVYVVTINSGIETKTPLVEYQYNTGAKRTQIKTITYPNSSTNRNVYDYEYNENGALSTVKLNANDKHIVTYDNLGALSTITNTDGRFVQYTDKGTSIYKPYKISEEETGYSLIYQSIITDDGEYIEENYGVTYKDCESNFNYDSDSGSSTSTNGIEINDKYRITQTNNTDWLGRKTSDTISVYNITNEVIDDENKVVTPAQTLGKIETEYSYHVASDGKTSTRLEEFINKTYNGSSTSETVYEGSSYGYDKQNRIISETPLNSTKSKYSYEYDKLGQLIRYNDAVANRSYTYSYDSNGNMLSKSEYNYTTGQLGTALDTINYTYGNSWEDQLSAYDGEQIEYDDIGNPTEYLGATLIWEGRNLKSYEKGSKKLQFEYDENGMRYRTTVTNSGSVSYYDYVWDNNQLVSMVFTSGDISQTAKYLYGSSSEPIGMVLTDEDGAINTYYYLKNAQSDITGIVNSYGKKIISYTYDVFGKRSEPNYYANVGTIEYAKYLQANILNPFAYRGYCYDADMGIYYLQSRYYDPNTGRFINADDTNYLNATGTVLGCNLFTYCENDPINRVDPLGTKFIVRRWMIALVLDAALLAIPGIGPMFAPVKAVAKELGLRLVKKQFSKNLLGVLTKIIRGLVSFCNKAIKLIKNYKPIKNFKFIKNLKAEKLVGSILGVALFKIPVYKTLDLIMVNIDICLSLGGFFSGILDYAFDKKMNDQIWVL